MIFDLVGRLAPYADITTFVVGLPTLIGTYYQSFKARQEARREREGSLHSLDCLEFISLDGECINLVPLETLHSLPREGDVILLTEMEHHRDAYYEHIANAKAALKQKSFHQSHSTTREAYVAVATVLRLIATMSLAATDVVQLVSVVE